MLEEQVKPEEVKAEEIPANLPVLEEMARVGLLLGHKKSKTHPRMKPYIFGIRNGVEVFDLSQTCTMLDKALEVVKAKVLVKGNVLLVGTTPTAKTLVEQCAAQLHFPYVTERWLGGTLTNFKTLSKRVAHFKKLKADKEAGRLDKYTKKERLVIDREIAKLKTKFSGVEEMEQLPALLFVVDLGHHLIAVREAQRMGIPVVAIGNTDTDPRFADYLIPANDRSREGIEWLLAKLTTAVQEAQIAREQAQKEVVAKA